MIPIGLKSKCRARRAPWVLRAIALCLSITCLIQPLSAHIFISRTFRAGAYPSHDGQGWIGEVFLNIPNFDLAHLRMLQNCMTGPGKTYDDGACLAGDLLADQRVDLRDMARLQIQFNNPHLVLMERLIPDREPDFTFRTDWIDFPAGPIDSGLDAEFGTLGDFFDAYIYDVSDPAKLDEPFGAFLVKFKGLLKVGLEDEIRVENVTGLPVWIDVGTMAYDAYRVRIGEIIYQRPNVKWTRPFYNFGPAVEVLGLFPIEITYVNIYDPAARFQNERAGVEIYSWHGDGLPWPAGINMMHEVRGPATLLPPRAIYQQEDIEFVHPGDFEADFDIDLTDFQWFQFCADPTFFFLPSFCRIFDFNGDDVVDLEDYRSLWSLSAGPGREPNRVRDP